LALQRRGPLDHRPDHQLRRRIPALGVERHETIAAIDAVRQGLELACSRRGADEIELKTSERDLVTAADVAVEEVIRAALHDSGIPVIGEEGGGEATGRHWLVDPICGTRNYASGIPLWCVNVALVEDDQVTVAAVGDPSTDDLLVAELGGGAWSVDDGRRLQATEESRTIVIEDSHADLDPARRDLAADTVAAAIRAFRWDIRALSTSLALPYVAAGRASGYVLFWSSALHVGAGVLLASEAGATVTDIEGKPWTIESDSLVAAATPDLHRDLLELVSR
jgi:myo-inositol-1(or 4)-monophosphatase